MSQTAHIGADAEDSLQIDVGHISMLLQDALSLESGLSRFADYLESKGFMQLLVVVSDISRKLEPLTLFINESGSSGSPCSEAMNVVRCPMIRKAMDIQKPFEALGARYHPQDYETVQHYNRHATSLGHREVGVIPLRLGELIYIFSIGVGKRSFGDSVRSRLIYDIVEFLSAAHVRFRKMGQVEALLPNVGRRKHAADNLSKREAECLTWTAMGKTTYEISIILGLSEHTINNYIACACHRLGAATRSHAVAIAIKQWLYQPANR